MKHISFAWTTPALLARRKTVTRRYWKATHAHGFEEGEVLAAYDTDIRAGGKKVAEIRLLRAPYEQDGSDIPLEDFEAEGFAYFAEHPKLVPEKAPPWMDGLTQENFRSQAFGLFSTLWVVRFKLLP